MPALLLAVALVFQAMEYYAARQAAETAARQAVDAARTFAARDGDGTARAVDVLGQLGRPLEAAQVTVAHRGALVVATVTGRAHQLVPGLGLAVTATATGPVEQLTPPP